VAKDLKFHFAKEIKDVLKVAVPAALKNAKKSKKESKK
jgi:hypothetical protein